MHPAENAPINHFDASAAGWDQRPTSEQLAALPPRLLDRISLEPEDVVLDFGAGTGLLATAIAPFVRHVVALDTSSAMLEMLRAKGHPNISTAADDVSEYSAAHAKSLTLIASCMALHHVADTATLMKDFARLLAPSGRIALIDLYAEDGSFHGTPEDNAAKGVRHAGFEPDTLRALAEKAGFAHIAFHPILDIRHRNGRTYPLFLMTGSLAAQTMNT